MSSLKTIVGIALVSIIVAGCTSKDPRDMFDAKKGIPGMFSGADETADYGMAKDSMAQDSMDKSSAQSSY